MRTSTKVKIKVIINTPAEKKLTSNFYWFLGVLIVNVLQKVQDFICLFPRQRNFTGCCFFKLTSKHGFEYWGVHTKY